MWIICFQPAGTDKYTPQLICASEEEAKQTIKRMPYSVVGNYFYMFVPMANPYGVFKREEPYQLPTYQQVIPYYVDDGTTGGRRRQWQLDIGDWPFTQPPICIN